MPSRRRATALTQRSLPSGNGKVDETSKAPQPAEVPSKRISAGKEPTKKQRKEESDVAAPESNSQSHDHERSIGKLEDNENAANVGKKRKRNGPVESGENAELPHNMGNGGIVKNEPIEDGEEDETKPSAKKRAKGQRSAKGSKKEPQDDEKAPLATQSTPKKMSKKADNANSTPNKEIKSPTKKETYGLSEGVSPFPNYPRPTPEECYKVAKLLQKAHPNCHPRPKTIPKPSQIVAGCGNVPSILDAMIRTLLSAATNGRNSSNAYQGMVKRYGNRQTGIGKGSVDYNAIRLAPQADLEKAIAKGGLAKNKSKNIKAILDMVHEENQRRVTEVGEAILQGPHYHPEPGGHMKEKDAQKNAEMLVAKENFLSLDHLHYLPTYSAISHLTKFPGIGVKTAACVALFCMQRDCFAVDTHVFRLCKWLGWVPDQSAPNYVKAKGEPRVDRDPTFSHLEVRIPDELKYKLHQLFIQHGKNCGRCRGNTSENHPEWAKGCPIEDLVNRRGPRKRGGAVGKATKTSAKSAKKGKQAEESDEASDEDEEEDEVEMSDLVEDEDDQGVEEAMPDLNDEEEYNVPAKTMRLPRWSTRTKTRETKQSASKSH